MTAKLLHLLLAATCMVLAAAPPAHAQDLRDRDNNGIPDEMESRRYRPGGGQQMGVRVRNLDTGVELTQVFGGSPAARAGLQPGDRIVSVGGYQVGYVGNKLYDLADEAGQRVGPNGIVRVLALQQRTGQLVNFDVPVGSGNTPVPPVVGPGGVIVPPPPGPGWGQAVLTGTIQSETPVRVPPGSTIQVRLVQEGINGAPDVVVTEATQPNFPGFPANYTLTYNRSQITPGTRYFAEARLLLGPQVLCATNQRYWVFGANPNTRLDLTVTPTATNPNQNAVEIIANWYRQYLGREADPAGLNAHVLALQSGRSLREVQTTLLSSNEFFDRCRNNPQMFVQQLYFLVLNRQPTPQDVNFWTDRLRKVKNNRVQLVREFLTQALGNG
jgi:uncharacterized lipoprotein YbaY